MSLVRLIAIGVLLMAAQIPAIAQEVVTVRGGSHSEFGRIVFDWTSPVGYDAKISGRNLTVRFDRPMQGISPAPLPLCETTPLVRGFPATTERQRYR